MKIKIKKLSCYILTICIILCVINPVHTQAKKNQNNGNGNSVEDFSYEIKGKKVILKSYKGTDTRLEIKTSYRINGKKYKTDISSFRVGIGNNSVKFVVFAEGFKKINNATFNSCDVQSVFFPKSLKKIYDNTLSYLHPDNGKIKIYYAGTKKQWKKIFKKYKRKTVKEAWNSSDDPEEKGKALGTSLADKLNSLIGGGYKSSDFEYFFSASPSDVK